MKTLTQLFVLLLTVTACSVSNKTQPQQKANSKGDTDFIVNGEKVKDVDPLEHSIVAIVSEVYQGQALCTGTLIANDIVLTAAHCVDQKPEKIAIVFKSNVNKLTNDDVRIVDHYIQHPYWNHPTSNGQGDIALLHFSSGIPEGYSPTRLVDEMTLLHPGQLIKMYGYGVTNGLREKGSGTLRMTESQLIRMSSPTEYVSDGRDASVCFGDSGGPAFVSIKNIDYQWGVASSVSNRACNESITHTGIMSYEPWIKEMILKLRK